MKKSTVNASKTYDVIIDNGLVDRVGEKLKEYEIGGKVCVITDKTVDALYGERVVKSLKEVGFECVKYVAKGGEKSKSGKEYLSALEFLAENEFTRSDVVLALGGGVIGDLTGFIAATYLRGIKFIQVPTTLLAFADSSVGGKTAINLRSGKNLVGAFNQPELVLCDLDTASTLTGKEYACGMAEIIKYGMIFDGDLLDLLENGMEDNAEEIVARCVDLKRIVVEKDEHDNGDRQLLNFGHTLGHAIEKASKFKIAHGYAVAVGMALITERAISAGFCDEKAMGILTDLLGKYNLPEMTEISVTELFETTLVDKKRKGEKITVVLPGCKGKCELKSMTVSEWKEFILG